MRRAQMVLGVLFLCIGVATPAWAAPIDQTPSTRPHCVVTAVDANTDSTLPNLRCFPTFAEAIAVATDGRVVLPPDAQTVDQNTLNAGLGQNSLSAIVIGIEYENKNFGGWSYVIQSTNSRGCNGYSYRINTLPSGRNNEISSARTYAGCKSSHYSGTYMTGSRYLCGCSQMGTMNDQTSSIYFSATGYRSS